MPDWLIFTAFVIGALYILTRDAKVRRWLGLD